MQHQGGVLPPYAITQFSSQPPTAAPPISFRPPPPPLLANYDEFYPGFRQGSFSGDEVEEEAGRIAAPAKRWPRQETAALLKIRSEMDAVFREATLKTPLWQEVSRKLAELGYTRSAKKCKEKFQNVYKYYKRTKDCRAGGHQDGESYLFFTQLEEISVAQQQQQQQQQQENWKSFVERVTKQVMERQEAMQKRLLDTMEKQEQERTIREEAWRQEETARRDREEELLEQASANAASRSAAIVSFIYKHTSQSATPPTAEMVPASEAVVASWSRWPKAEVDKLIELRRGMEEAGAKAPLWEEVAAGMRRMGYSRSAKRCKEKWENINKYFKKVKGSNKKRSQDAKTCTYFQQLDAIYQKKASTRQSPVEAEFDNEEKKKEKNEEEDGEIEYKASACSYLALVQ